MPAWMMAKLFVPSGAFFQGSAGDAFASVQFGFCGLLPPYFKGSGPPSSKSGDVRSR
jgi:phospholipase C